VIAPGLVWCQPGDRVKTDPRDARRLAAQYAGGMLRAIYVLSPEQEVLRDLVRAREDARHDRMRARGRLGKFLLRQGRSMPTQSWEPARFSVYPRFRCCRGSGLRWATATNQPLQPVT
jgi:transposase